MAGGLGMEMEMGYRYGGEAGGVGPGRSFR